MLDNNLDGTTPDKGLGELLRWQIGDRLLGRAARFDEPIGEPPERIRAYFEAHGLDAARLWVFDVGETRALTR